MIKKKQYKLEAKKRKNVPRRKQLVSGKPKSIYSKSAGSNEVKKSIVSHILKKIFTSSGPLPPPELRKGMTVMSIRQKLLKKSESELKKIYKECYGKDYSDDDNSGSTVIV